MSRAGSAGHRAEERDDPESIAALRAGDLTAFEKVVREQARGLLSVARRMLRNEDDACEAVQDAFVSAFRSCRRFEGSSRISTWLHRIVVNSCLMRLRTQRRRIEVPIDDWLPRFLPDGHHETSFVDWSNAAHAMIEQEETCALVRRCVDQLPDSYRTVLLMHDIEGIPIDQVATALDISSTAVHIRLHSSAASLTNAARSSLLRGAAS